jgi:tetratricopeptide (TPR) repeat protein
VTPRDPPGLDWDRFPWPESVSWFARGLGAAHGGDPAEAARAAARLQELESRAEKTGETVFASQIRVLRLELEGWNAHAAHDDATAVARIRQASEIEGSTPKPPVTPAPTLPADEILGDLLLELDRAEEALVAYRQALQRFPRRFNSTLGTVRALAASGNTRAAHEAWCELEVLGKNGTRLARLDPIAGAGVGAPCGAAPASK